jgi:hypothetical protein
MVGVILYCMGSVSRSRKRKENVCLDCAVRDACDAYARKGPSFSAVRPGKLRRAYTKLSGREAKALYRICVHYDPLETVKKDFGLG